MTNTPTTPDARRTQPETFRARRMQASLTVNDLQKSIAWYTEVLRFVIDKKYDRDGKLMAVSLKAGTVRILLAQDDFSKGRDRVKGVGCSLQFTTVQDVDALAKRMKDAGAKLENEPTDMPWGARMFRLRDPDGFLITISSEYQD